MEDAEVEEDILDDIGLPQVGNIKFTHCNMEGLANYAMEALLSEKTMVCVILSGGEMKRSAYALMRKKEHSHRILKANPSQISLEGRGDIMFYMASSMADHYRMEEIRKCDLLLMDIDSVKNPSVSNFLNYERDSKPVVVFIITDKSHKEAMLPPAVSKATRVAGGIKYALKIALGLVVCLLVILIALRQIMRWIR